MDQQAFATKLGLTCLAAMAAETATYPIDTIKTRLQLQGEQHHMQPAHARSAASPLNIAQASTSSTAASEALPHRQGAFAMARSVVAKEGAKGLYAGLTPAVVRHIFYTGTRISVYEGLRSSQWLAPQPQGAEGGQRGQGQQGPGLGAKLLMGLSAGATGQLVAVPADLVKVRMQADGRLVAAGLQAAPRYTGMADALRQIVGREGGVAALWRGAGPAVQRAALVNLGELTTYDTAKQAVLASGVVGGEGPAAHAAASGASGFFAAVCSVPADVIKTRLMSQDPNKPLYRGTIDCLAKTVQREGFFALYKGFFPTWARLAPWQLVFWTSYEQLRQLAGLGAF